MAAVPQVVELGLGPRQADNRSHAWRAPAGSRMREMGPRGAVVNLSWCLKGQKFMGQHGRGPSEKRLRHAVGQQDFRWLCYGEGVGRIGR